MEYDIFISYKRKSLAAANNLYYRLISRGYSVFFDLEEMQRDNYDEQLLHYIGNAKDVFIILEEGSLDSSSEENWMEDWFLREIAYALESNRNIIPILIGGYNMPKQVTLPDGLQGLVLKNSPEFSFSYFEEYLDKLIEKGYITSIPKERNRYTSVFKLFSDKNCQVFIEGKLICCLEGMNDEPYYYPVLRKGDYRFKCVLENGKKIFLDSIIDDNQERIVHIKKRIKNYRMYVIFLIGFISLINLGMVGMMLSYRLESRSTSNGLLPPSIKFQKEETGVSLKEYNSFFSQDVSSEAYETL